jgi:predicted glycoside hydrolase/deacetylase ChbG (UPF0249 family)
MSKRATGEQKLIVNIDDLAMCHGANVAFLDLFRRGRADSGSVMVPCPWFREIADAGVADPSLKLGVHFTITAEKKQYRWRPLTAPSRASGLVDADGFFHNGVAQARTNAHPDAVEAELRAQIETFLAAGLTPSHFDPHQGAVLAPEFVAIYVKLGAEYDVPVVFPRDLSAYGPLHNLGVLDLAIYRETAARFEAEGRVLADRVLETPWHRDQPAGARYRSLFAGVGPGLTFMAMHANAPGEIEAIEPDSAAIRTDEYDVLRAPGPIDWIDDLPVVRGSLSDFRTVPRAA